MRVKSEKGPMKRKSYTNQHPPLPGGAVPDPVCVGSK